MSDDYLLVIGLPASWLSNLRDLRDSNGCLAWQPSFVMGEPDTFLSFPIRCWPPNNQEQE